MSTEESFTVSSSPSGIDRDLENARVLIEDEPWSETPQKYRKAAEVILRRILTIDPDNNAAKALLAKAEAPVVEVSAAALSEAPVLVQPSVREEEAPQKDDFPFTIQTIGTTPERKRKPFPIFGFIGIGVAVVLSGLLIFGFPSNKLKGQYAPRLSSAPSQTAETPPEPVNAVSAPAAPAATTAPPGPPPASVQSNAKTAPDSIPPAAIPPTAKPTTTLVASAALATTADAASSADLKKKSQAASAGTGKLAVSSATMVDIYMADQLLGSTPITLDLPAGNQRLEYRHGDLKKIVTHVISANETTATMVTFDIPVQINAKPWAQVFIDGSQRQLLGQTPLSEVRVPIGSVLVFENPNFQGKRYRVKGNETEIRISFP